MKKTLLVAALAAGFAGVAHAESSVTLYGVADVGYGYKATKTTVDGVTTKVREFSARNGVQNGSRWGLKGSEDLGNGTSAIFQLESGFNLGNGTSAQGGRLFGRKAVVGLTGESWGTLTIGRQYNAADDFVSGIDPFDTSWSQAGAQSVFGNHLSMRLDNAIKYVSPNFDGFLFGLGVVHQDTQKKVEGEKSGNKTTGFTAGAGYNNGGLELGVSFDVLRSKDYGSDSYTQKAWSIGAAYDFDVVKLHAIFAQQRDGVFGAAGAFESDAAGAYAEAAAADAEALSTNDTAEKKAAARAAAINGVNAFFGKGYRSNAWLVGLSAPVGEAGKVMFSYAGSVSKNKLAVYDGVKLKTNVFSLGYRHALSKRTSLYAVASYGKLTLKDEGTKDKFKSTDVAVGLTHRF